MSAYARTTLAYDTEEGEICLQEYGKHQFQVGCMYFLTLKQNKSLNEKFERCLSSKFDVLTSQQMRKTMKNDHTFVLALLMFYTNSNSLIYKVLCAVVYCLSEMYVCIEHLYLQK